MPPESKWYAKEAANNQYDRIRGTVRVSTDGVLFCCHDDYINSYVRNPDGTELTEQIRANDCSIAQLDSYDWGIKYGEYYAGHKTPRLEELMKYCGMYGLHFTYHSGSWLANSEPYINTVMELADKYGLTDNMIVLGSGGQDFSMYEKFKAHNKSISYYVGGEESWWTESVVERVNSLKTGYNKIYVQLYPFGTDASDNFIKLAKDNDWQLYNATRLSKDALLQPSTFEHGYTLIECRDVPVVKDTVADYVNSLILG